jgi:tetratricopeptide (TPR) repeat protein
MSLSRYFNDPEVDIYSTDSEEVQLEKNKLGLEKYPERKDVFLHSLIFHYLWKTKEYDKALACAQEAIACTSSPDNLSEHYSCLKMVYVEQKNYPLALEIMHKVIELDPTCIDAILELGDLYLEMKDYKNAIATYKKVLTTPDEDGNIWTEEYNERMASLYTEEKNYDDAIAIYDKLMQECKTDEERSDVYEALSTMYEHQGNFKLAIENAQMALKTAPNSLSAAHRLGTCYWINKQHKEALGAYNKMLKMEGFDKNSADPHVKMNLNWHWRYYYRTIAPLYVDMKKYKEALDCYEKMIPIFDSPNDSYEALEQLASINYTIKQYKQAVPYLQRIIELWPNQYARAYTSMATYYMEEEKDLENALNYLHIAAKANQQHEGFFLGNDRNLGATINLWIGNIYLDEHKDEEQAIIWYERILNAPELNQENVLPELKDLASRACDRLYKIYSDRGDEKKAKQYKDRRTGLEVIKSLFSPDWRPDPPKTLDERLKEHKDKDSALQQLPYHYTKLPEDFTEKQAALKPIQEAFEKDMLENPAYKEYFKKFSPDSVDAFIKQYVQHKVGLVSGWEFYIDEPPKVVGWRNSAKDMLELILHKKLFNQQLLWRAEKISIPEISVSNEFEYWDGNLELCPFIDEITPAEINAMKQFLLSSNFSEDTKWFMCSWQDYDRIMEQNEEGDREFMPEWYEYYDGCLGTGALLLLPDTRGGKETYYENIYYDWVRKNPLPPPPQPVDAVAPPPFLMPLVTYDGSAYTDFMEKFENDYLCKLHQGWLTEKHQKPDEYYSEEAVNDAIFTLKDADEPIYMEGGLVWYEAIIRCAQKFKNTKVADMLDDVYANYLAKRELNLHSHQAPVSNEGLDRNNNDMKERILKGRELNGELRDFNY